MFVNTTKIVPQKNFAIDLIVVVLILVWTIPVVIMPNVILWNMLHNVAVYQSILEILILLARLSLGVVLIVNAVHMKLVLMVNVDHLANVE